MSKNYDANANLEAEVTSAALNWRAREDMTERARQDLIKTIDRASDRGISEIKLSKWAGVSRPTIRSWRGKA